MIVYDESGNDRNKFLLIATTSTKVINDLMNKHTSDLNYGNLFFQILERHGIDKYF